MLAPKAQTQAAPKFITPNMLVRRVTGGHPSFSAIRKVQHCIPSTTTRLELSFFKGPVISVLLNNWLY